MFGDLHYQAYLTIKVQYRFANESTLLVGAAIQYASQSQNSVQIHYNLVSAVWHPLLVPCHIVRLTGFALQ